MLFLRSTPLAIFDKGSIWVRAFFILSGFVGPMSFIKSKNSSSLLGSAIRRYPRLMLPVMVTLSIYYTIVRCEWSNNKDFDRIKGKDFRIVLKDSFVDTWKGSIDYNSAYWTLYIELYASFAVYIVAYIASTFSKDNKWRYAVYLAIPVLVWTIMLSDSFNLTNIGIKTSQDQGARKIMAFLPVFLLGSLLCDLECNDKTNRPLDKLRNLSSNMTIIRDVVLLFLALTYGSYHGTDECDATHLYVNPGTCEYWRIFTLNFSLSQDFCNIFGAFCLILLGLLSDMFQKFLLARPL